MYPANGFTLTVLGPEWGLDAKKKDVARFQDN